MLETVSLIGLLVMIAGLAGLAYTGNLISSNPVAIALELPGVWLIVWARLVFGSRSFHATANPTKGGLVTTGPYHYIRHPIYTGGCVIACGAVIAHVSMLSVWCWALVLAGGLVRMLCEERLLMAAYPDYAQYTRSTKRMIPFIF